MKRTIYIALLAALLISCGEEKPNFEKKPGGGGVETAGLGAVALSTAESLIDNDLKTYFEAKVDQNKSVSIVLPAKGGSVVAYTLVSSGVTLQDANGKISTPFDPAEWTLEGSNDAKSWTKIDQRTSVEFFARFQKHIYYLSSPANFTQYKLTMSAKGGEKISLSDVLFHGQDPYAMWADFVSPAVVFIDTAQDKGSKLYDVLVQDKQAYLKWHAREIATILYFSDKDERFPVTTIEYFLDPMPGQISHKGGSSPKINIHYSTDWIQKSASESLLKLSLETRGVLFHEMTHAFQLEPKGIPSYNQGNVSWAAIEGLADAVRTYAGYHDYANRQTSGSLMSGYQTTGFFLYWLTQSQDPDAIRKLNASMRTLSPWSWDAALKFAIGPQASEQPLWMLYKADTKNYQKQ